MLNKSAFVGKRVLMLFLCLRLSTLKFRGHLLWEIHTEENL